MSKILKVKPMGDSARLERSNDLQRDLLAWTALHHFLPAALIRELAEATLAAYAPRCSLDELFDDHLTGDGVTDTWAIVPRALEADNLAFLQQHIRVLVWANDSDTYPPRRDDARASSFEEDLSNALRVGRFDFGAAPQSLKRLRLPHEASVGRIVDALLAGISSVGEGVSIDAVEEPLQQLSAPLQVVALKHFGDLCADIDAWAEAGALYRRAEGVLGRCASAAWAHYLSQLADLVRQSAAISAWITQGADVAAPQLASITKGVSSPATRLSVLNGSHEALVARMEASDEFGARDVRSATLLPPLLLSSHEVSSAAEAWHEGRYDSAYRRFWGALRRQVALGSYSESRSTKALYGRTLIGEVNNLERNRHSPQSFELGVRLLIESGRPRGVESLPFPIEVVERYVSRELIHELGRVADKHIGVRHGRNLVFVELLAKWGENAPRHAKEPANTIVETLIARTFEFEVTFDEARNVGGQGLKLLQRLADKRPDLLRRFESSIADLVVHKALRREWWTAASGALELAIACADSFAPASMRAVIGAALSTLQNKDADDASSFVTRPALQLLSSERALKVAQGDDELGRDYMATLLHYGVAQRYAGVGLLVALSGFGRHIPLSESDRSALTTLVDEARRGVLELNSSAVTDFIRALILSVQHGGRYAAADAIESLIKILCSAHDRRPSLGLPYAYGPILDLTTRREELLQSGFDPNELEQIMARVAKALASAWTAITERPTLLASFSIPPRNEVNPTLVHNWSVATRKFADTFGDLGELQSILKKASSISALAPGMSRAAITGAPPDRLEAAELEHIDAETAEEFYAALGRRLHIADLEDEAGRRRIIERLLRRCLVLGPRELDIAIFMVAAPMHHALDVDVVGSDYVRQLTMNWPLYVSLQPFLRAWYTDS